jgi:hypothetical protein
MNEHHTSDGEQPRQGTARMWRIEAAAGLAGMSANLLEAGIVRGEIPVILRRVGPGGRRFVNIHQLKSWLNGTPTNDEDLFQ